ncbi:alanine racemase [Candidatus Peregrinibacteria bacterium]|nr:alanine racemase [Candidatus Peregrinibacteria bacterium]
MKEYRVWAEVNLGAFRHNFSAVQRHISTSTKILAVVKADAYGHGAVAIAKEAFAAGAIMVGVGDSSEALELRESGITGPILILGAIIEEEIPRVIKYDIATTIHSVDFLPRLNQEAREQNKRMKVHLKIDTGMGRLGALPKSALEIAKEIEKFQNLELAGINTHLSTVASGNIAHTEEQLAKFKEVLGELTNAGIKPQFIHAANSAATFSSKSSHFNMVRLGIALYGLDPGIFSKNGFKLEPVLTLKTKVAFLKGATEGSYIGYDQKYKIARNTMIATCPVGYNDGYPYLLSNKATVLVKGKRAPLVGTVTMDYIMVDVGDIPDIKVGDEVTLIGKDGDGRIKVEELAGHIGTIPYEITCALGKRVRRVYV